ncbi:MAG: (d)CMP kinase [Spirochaetales bacterium]|nr:(d)CMP kinase [Leptospiraceae bacterium]MCP5482750.1 (d)CMP kinase [Spirochaetales bacterium]MCP5485244.1 (d)CMP kinase [Spirochaetales bacterium]
MATKRICDLGPVEKRMVITLDGPAGSGKSTIAGRLAKELGFVHADSGAMYRTLTLACMRVLGPGQTADDFGRDIREAGIDPAGLDCHARIENGAQVNLIGKDDVGSEIRTPLVTARIRYIADSRAFREAVNTMLRDFATTTDLVVDGRDIGTVVFPEAGLKFYLDASSETRAARRLREFRLRDPSFEGSLDRIQADIERRDREDRDRPFGALQRPADSILIDTSTLDPDGVLNRLLGHLQIHF